MDTRTFLALEGLLEENGRFELGRAYETPVGPRQTPVRQPAVNAAVRLLTEKGEELTRAPVDVRYPQGCGSAAGQVGLALLRAFVPAHPDARVLELVVEGRAVAKLPIGSRTPGLAGPTVKLASKGRVAQVRWKVDGKPAPAVHLSLVIDGRDHPVAAVVQGSGASVDLEPWAGRGKASVRVTAESAFRTAVATSAPFALPPADVRGRILAPREGEQWSFGRPGSLMANLMDQNGRPLPWDPQRLSWTLDGKPLSDRRAIADPGEVASGKHTLTLTLAGAKKSVIELDRVAFHVRAETADEKEWRALVDAHGAAANGDLAAPAVQTKAPARVAAPGLSASGVSASPTRLAAMLARGPGNAG